MGEAGAVATLTAEFVGTFFLVFAVGCNVLTGSATWAVTSIACTLMVLVYALGGVSGANLNPAVSVALGLSKKLPWLEVGKYVGAQLAGGAAAGVAYGAVFGRTFNLEPAKGALVYQVFLAEMLYTLMLCFVVLNVAASKKHAGNQFYGLAIGFVVIAGGYGAGHISGGCFNPAVALGIDLSSAALGFGWCLPYGVFELVGAALAAGLFRVVRPEEGDEDAAPLEKYPMASRFVSEFIGTYFLVLTIGLNVLGGSKAPVWSIAASLTSMVFALGSCSGAHFNPAVTCSIVCSDRNLVPVEDFVTYVVAQCFGGIMAGFTYAAMENGRTFEMLPGLPHGSFSWIEAIVAEMVFTFFLCYVVLSVATTLSPLSEYFGLAIGSCIMAGGSAIGSISGGCLNPAVSVGICCAHFLNGGRLWHAYPYAVFQALGGMAAAELFKLTHTSEYDKPKATESTSASSPPISAEA